MFSFFMLTMISFYLGILGMLMNRLHFLSILLCLEMLLISMFMAMAMWSVKTNTKFLLPKNLILLTLSACEASTGLSLMVALSRSHNSDLVVKIKLLQQ